MAIFDKKRMVASTIKVVLITIIIVVLLLWFLGGGVGKIIKAAGSFHFLSFSDLLVSSSTLSDFQLPWQPAMPAIDVTPVVMPGDAGAEAASPSYDSSYAGASPYQGKIGIEGGAARTQTTSGEYIELRAAPGISSPIDISGWSLESALSGVRVYLPQATGVFLQGRINPVGNVTLAAGASAIVLTGPSPVGVSFRENKCTGYLGTLQPFVPPLAQQCPSPFAVIPRTEENEARLGANCFDFLSSLPSCTFPTSVPPTLTTACRDIIQAKLSYGGCVSAYRNTTSFAQNTWRLFLTQGAPLWGSEHDVLRLLDGQGRVVDVLNY